MKHILIAVAFISILSSCTKTEGPGGGATVNGTVITNDYNSFGTLLATFPSQDQKVFIIYGSDDNIVDDDVSTSYDGTFQFNYLRKGTYTAFVYSDCVTCDSGDSAVKVTFQITDKKEVINLSDIIIRK